ncbi:response regulator [Desulfovibrio ferrophilus]|uniref:Response regulator receiver protein n=1 Tax=Desulfovibrio ferrophilus TaxID=241368 RepID=A0A2Z6AVY1_9BACT|nr:response regulator [Desulfovibrio ferrophilus]BBD07373.1 response regulator receiver protein [Desulfovibrio ferrophilus]
MRILLVDDERDLVAALAERFSFRGIDADFATSGDDALNMAKENAYDLAVLDVKMPKISGLELSKRLYRILPEMKCIFLTGHGSALDFEAGASSGAPYLVKPVNIDLLVKEIHKVLGTGEDG